MNAFIGLSGVIASNKDDALPIFAISRMNEWMVVRKHECIGAQIINK
jgi:hypothetical protein